VAESLESLVDRIETAGDPELGLVDYLVARIQPTDPQLAEAIRLCAIPRRFDAAILGILRIHSDEASNRRLVERLAQHPFVLPRGDGSFRYHDDTRDALLRQWHDDPDRRQRFVELNEILTQHYLERRARAARQDQQVAQVAELVRGADENRYAQLAAESEQRVSDFALEALYHATLVSPESGLDMLSREIERYIGEGRPFVTSLLDGMHRYLEGLPYDTDRASWQRWLRYWTVSVGWTVEGDAVQTEAALRELLAQSDDDAKLQVWVLDDLAVVLSAQARTREAQQHLTRCARIADAADENLIDRSLLYLRLAETEAQLAQLGARIESCERALEIARTERTPGRELAAHLRLSEALNEGGRFHDALDHLLEGVCLSRVALPTSRVDVKAVVAGAVTLVQERAPELLEVVLADVKRLPASTGERVRWGVAHARGMRCSGMFRRAEALLDELEPLIAKSEDRHTRVDVLAERLTLQTTMGLHDEAFSAVDAALQPDSDGSAALTAFDRAMLLALRGVASAARGNWPATNSDLVESARIMNANGQEAVAARFHLVHALEAAELGHLDEAAALLEGTRPYLGEREGSVWLYWHQALGNLELRRGRFGEAQKAVEAALEMAEARSLSEEAVSAAGALVRVAESQRNAHAALRAVQRADRWWRLRAERDAWDPSDAQRRAAEDNANGMLQFTTNAPERGTLVAASRDLFRAAADRCPDEPWYWLNLSYAARALGELGEASDAMRQAIAVRRDWDRPAALVRQLCELELARSRALTAAGRVPEAVAALRHLEDEHGDRLSVQSRRDMLVALGDAHLAGHEVDEAERTYTAAARLDGADEDAATTSRVAGRRALAAALEDRLVEAAHLLRRACEVGADADMAPTHWLGELADVPASPRSSRAFADLLRIGAADASLDADTRQSFIRASAFWAANTYRSRARPLNRTPLPSGMDDVSPFCTRLQLHGDGGLFPQGGETSAVIRMLDVGIPRLRQRIRDTTGVVVPGVSIRATDLGEGEYRIVIDEVTVSSGRVGGEALCLDEEGATALGLHGILDEVLAIGTGVWLDADDAGTAARHGLTLVRPDEIMVAQLEVVVRRHIDDFVDVDTVVSALADLQGQGAETKDLVSAVVPDVNAVIRLAGVLRALAADGVPLGDLRPILSAMADADADEERPALIERARAAVEAADGQAISTATVRLPDRFASVIAGGVRHIDGRSFLALPHVDAEDFLGQLRGWLEEHGRPPVVAVERGELRRFVAAAIDRVSPGTRVVASAAVTAASGDDQSQPLAGSQRTGAT
jgi:tetratricopeptide (TPR) repeat protein